MKCVHCAVTNPDGATFCVSCGRDPATLEEWPADLHEWIPPVPEFTAVTSRMALIALALGLLSIFPLAGVAAVILGHLALVQISRSAGSLRGRDVARLALICGYSGLIIFAALFFGTAWYSRVPIRAVLVESLSAASSASVPTQPVSLSEAANENEIHAIQSLVQLHMAESLYQRRSLTSSFSCQVNELKAMGFPSQALAILSEHGYVVTIQQCRQNESGQVTGYNALAISKVGVNARNFCTDETGVIRIPSVESGLLDCGKTGIPLK